MLGHAHVIGTGRSRAASSPPSGAPTATSRSGADRLEDATGQADLVVDIISGEVLAHAPALLRLGGTLVTIKADAQLPHTRGATSGRGRFFQESSPLN